MHLLEETTVRTEWTRAPGPVDAYEIQFTPTVRGALRRGQAGRTRVGGTRLMQDIPGNQCLHPDVWVPEAAAKPLLSCRTWGTERLGSVSAGTPLVTVSSVLSEAV